jgi:hypothetical protein
MNGSPQNLLETVIQELLASHRAERENWNRRLDRLEQRLSDQPTTTTSGSKKIELALRAGELLTQIGPPLWRGIIWLAPRVVLWGGLLQAAWSMLRRLVGL